MMTIDCSKCGYKGDAHEYPTDCVEVLGAQVAALRDALSHLIPTSHGDVWFSIPAHVDFQCVTVGMSADAWHDAHLYARRGDQAKTLLESTTDQATAWLAAHDAATRAPLEQQINKLRESYNASLVAVKHDHETYCGHDTNVVIARAKREAVKACILVACVYCRDADGYRPAEPYEDGWGHRLRKANGWQRCSAAALRFYLDKETP